MAKAYRQKRTVKGSGTDNDTAGGMVSCNVCRGTGMVPRGYNKKQKQKKKKKKGK